MAAQEDNSKYLLYGGGLVLIYLAGNKIFQKLGLAKDAEDAAEDAANAAVEKENYFDPAYLEERRKKYTCKILSNDGKLSAEKLYNAKGIFNDDEDAVYGVFRKLESKTQVSQIAGTFFKLYNKDLKNYLQPPNGFLSESEWNKVVGICSKLQEGIKVNGVYK